MWWFHPSSWEKGDPSCGSGGVRQLVTLHPQFRSRQTNSSMPLIFPSSFSSGPPCQGLSHGPSLLSSATLEKSSQRCWDVCLPGISKSGQAEDEDETLQLHKAASQQWQRWEWGSQRGAGRSTLHMNTDHSFPLPFNYPMVVHKAIWKSVKVGPHDG